MPHRFEDLNVRLIQVRFKPEVEAEEYRTFVRRTGLEPAQLRAANVLKDVVDETLLEGMDAVIIGGAGAYSVTQTYDWTQSLIDLVLEISNRNMPLFGSCWGHQFIARAFGGSVIHDPDRGEIGCHPVELTPEGRNDRLFGDFPSPFMANMGHHDRVDRLPENAVELATSAVSPVQAFVIRGSPIYGTQFHSELDAETERSRLFAYRSHYPILQDDATFQEIVDTLRETTEVDGLLKLFLERFALRRQGSQ